MHEYLAEQESIRVSFRSLCSTTSRTCPRDLILPPTVLDETLNFRAVPSFGADALRGPGVFETLRASAELVLRRLSAPVPADVEAEA